MSLGIAFKGPEGIVLAADSRVTLSRKFQSDGEAQIISSTFDNATKLLRVNGQDYVGAVTFGLGAIGSQQFRTAHSFIPEFEAELANKDTSRLNVQEFAKRLSSFYMDRWKDAQMSDPWPGPPMVFLVGGYDEGKPYGQVFEIVIPHTPEPIEKQAETDFGMTWGGQREFADRLLQGFDSEVLMAIREKLKLTDQQLKEIEAHLKQRFSARIPYQFLPLQDCVDLAIFLIQATIKLQTWTVDVRGVGGAVDVATITRTEGFQAIQQKSIRGE